MNSKPLEEIEVGEILSFHEINGVCCQSSPYEVPNGFTGGLPVAYLFMNYRAIPKDENRYIFALEESSEEQSQKLYKLVAKTPDFDIANRALFEANDYYLQKFLDANPWIKYKFYGHLDYDDLKNKQMLRKQGIKKLP